MQEEIDHILQGIGLCLAGAQILRESGEALPTMGVANAVTEAFGDGTPLSTQIYAALAAESALFGILNMLDEEALVAALRKGKENG